MKMEKVLNSELQIAERSRRINHEPLTNLSQFITEQTLWEIYHFGLNKNSSPGVDGKYWYTYGPEFNHRLPDLLSEFKSGRYRAPNIKRVEIPKDDGSNRTLGLTTIEDKILQESVRRVLNPIYEQEFKDFSYGYRSGKSCHQAIEYLFQEVSFKKLHYVIDADLKDFFGSVNHEFMRKCLDLRVKDGVIRRAIGKWLKAKVMFAAGELKSSDKGTPQGGLISPLLSNIYLHYALDCWFSEKIQPNLKGQSSIVRYADDFVICFRNKEDAELTLELLDNRMKQCKLELHPEKTKIVNLKSKRGEGDRSFDFLGFTHYLSKTRKGFPVLKRKTSSKKFRKSISNIEEWIKRNRHQKLRELMYKLNQKVRGHYNYYGITFNSRKLGSYHQQVRRILQKWLNRRGGKAVWNWERFHKLTTQWIPLAKPSIKHSYLSVKPI